MSRVIGWLKVRTPPALGLWLVSLVVIAVLGRVLGNVISMLITWGSSYFVDSMQGKPR